MGYIYTTRMEITKENAVALLSASDYLQISGKGVPGVVNFFRTVVSNFRPLIKMLTGDGSTRFLGM